MTHEFRENFWFEMRFFQKNFIFFILSPRTSVNKRFCQIIFLSTFTVILLCGSCLLPFPLIKLAEKAKAYSDADYETYSGQGKAKADEMDQTHR